MASNFFKIKNGANLGSQATDPGTASEGDIYTNSTTNKVKIYINGAWRDAVTATDTQTLTGKSISGAANTITNVSLSTAVTGTLPIASGGTNNSTAYTSGSVVFSDGTKLTQNNSGLFWDNTNSRLGLGTTSPTSKLELSGTGSQQITLTSTDAGTQQTRFYLRNGAGTFYLMSGNDAANSSYAAMKVVKDSGAFTVNNISFSTSNELERMRIDATGNVGIGTTAPQTKLHAAQSASSSVQLRLERLSGSPGYTDLGSDTNGFYIWPGGNAAGNYTNFDLSGNVGIGSVTPTEKLDVNGSVRIRNNLSVDSELWSNVYFATNHKYRNNGYAYRIMQSTATGGDIRIDTAASGTAGGTITWDERLRISITGNVGIGTSSPGAKLDVNGSLKASSLALTTALPISSGGSGQITQQAAINALVGTVGTAGKVLRSDGTNVTMSSIQGSDIASGAVAIANGGTGTTTKTEAFDALAPSTTAGDIIVHNGTDNVRQGIGSDGQVLVVDTSQSNKLKWTTLQQGAKNYISYSSFENNATTGWNKGTVTWTSGAPSGAPTVGTAASVTTFATTATNPLAGSYSLQVGGTIAQGQGIISDLLNIDREDRAKILQGSFYYEVVSGAANANFSGTSSNTLSVYIYDVTNTAWVQPAGVYNLVQNSGQGYCTFTFQTASNASQYRLFVVAANAASGAITMNFDDFKLGPQTTSMGPAMSDAQAYTPTVSGLGSGSYSATGYWSRRGDKAFIQVIFNKDATAGTGSTPVTVSIPSGIALDSRFINFIAGNGDTGTTTFVTYVSGSNIYLGTNSNTNIVGSNIAANSYVILNAEFPVSGWSSNTVQSADTDTRVVALNTTGSSTSISTAVTLVPTTVSKDTHGAMSSGVYTVPVSGFYQLGGTIQTSTATTYLTLMYRKNQTGSNITLANAVTNTAAAYNTASGSTVAYFDAGNTIEFRAQASATCTPDSAALTYIYRLSGPAVVQATETVAVAASGSGSLSLTTGFQSVTFGNEEIDTHGAFNGTTFTAPVSGIYEFNIPLTLSASAANNSYIQFLKNGTTGIVSTSNVFARFTSSGIDMRPANLMCKLNAGESIAVQLACDNNGNISVNQATSRFHAKRIGN